MTEIVGVGFVKASKTYYFDPEGIQNGRAGYRRDRSRPGDGPYFH